MESPLSGAQVAGALLPVVVYRSISVRCLQPGTEPISLLIDIYAPVVPS
jgi:hypothetical protein